jgi:hypothetical protein
MTAALFVVCGVNGIIRPSRSERPMLPDLDDAPIQKARDRSRGAGSKILAMVK